MTEPSSLDFAGFEGTNDFRRREDTVSPATARFLQDSSLDQLLDIQPRQVLPERVKQMYIIDEKDSVVIIKNIPQSSIGAPIPVVISDEFVAVAAFYLQDTPDDWDGKTVRVVTVETEGEPIALVRFSRCYSLMFGPPNDEAFDGHPLANRGLTPYGAFLIESSSWIRQLEKMNSVHPHHRSERFRQLKHYVLTFHDSTFECVAESYNVEVHKGSMRSVIPRMIDLLTDVTQ